MKDSITEKEELMPYQKRFPDSFIENRLLKKPKTKGGLMYTALDEESVMIHADHFLPTWDGTDHLHFVCEKCKSVADILTVKFDTSYSSDPKYALFFYLGCRGCGATGQRKIYLDRRAHACRYQVAYQDGKIYLYGNTEKPEKTIAVKEKVNLMK